MMHIEEVVSYLGAWDKINRTYQTELSEIVSAASKFYLGEVEVEDRDDGRNRYGSREYWEKAFMDLDWSPQSFTKLRSPDGKRLSISSLGPTKNRISAQRNFGHPSELARWLFHQGTLAVRYGVVELPVLVTLARKTGANASDEARIAPNFGFMSSFQHLKSQLDVLAPLSIPFPFLILGLTEATPLLASVTELDADPNVVSERVVIDRSIEFPLEYHQAGLGILNYFGSYLRENYPDRQAKVRIEQQGLTVRMIVETSDGNIDTVEKALREYEMVFTGRVQPEAITSNERVILDLRNELRIAQFRIDSQQDIIAVQNNRIDKLMDILGNGLNAAHARPISLQISPSFHNSQSITINPDISSALNDITELLDSLPPTEEGEEVAMVLKDLSGSLEAIESETNPAKIGESAGMAKLGKFLGRLASGNEQLSKAINSIDKGSKLIASLIRTYNKVALLCGIPSVPGL
jgi:hypothetical protein